MLEWNFFPQWVYFYKELWPCLFFKFKILNVSDRLYQMWLRFTGPTFFQRGMAKSLPQWFHHWSDSRLSGKSMLENVLAYLQSREELNSSVFEELQEQRFQKETFANIIRSKCQNMWMFYVTIEHKSSC